jgi:hypothetical protein
MVGDCFTRSFLSVYSESRVGINIRKGRISNSLQDPTWSMAGMKEGRLQLLIIGQTLAALIDLLIRQAILQTARTPYQ